MAVSDEFNSHAKKYLIGALIAALGAGSYIAADVVFNDFQAGTTISASEMNAKLNALKDAVNALVVPDVCPENAPQRFTDNGDGTICDSTTGLMWEKKVGTVGVAVDCASSACLTTSAVNNLYSWGSIRPNGLLFRDFLADINHVQTYSNDGISLVASIPPAPAYTDWRIPTVVELSSILLTTCPGGGAACIDPVFGPTQAYLYWTSTSDASDPFGAMFVSFDNGTFSFQDKRDAYHARAVRSGR
jgi:hypothetical protein